MSTLPPRPIWVPLVERMSDGYWHGMARQPEVYPLRRAGFFACSHAHYERVAAAICADRLVATRRAADERHDGVRCRTRGGCLCHCEACWTGTHAR